MLAEVLSTGEELLTGNTVDTNAAYLSEQLTQEGVRVVSHMCIGDSIDRIAAMLKMISERSHIALVTGGLGPTSDDVTAAAAASASDDELFCHPRALESIQAFFQSRGYEMTDANRKQAMLPRQADMIPNRNGTAPGFSFSLGKCRFFFLPGVPREMRRMFQTDVLPAIREMQGRTGAAFTHKTFSVFGLPESKVNEMLSGFQRRFPTLGLGFQATFPQIQVKIFSQGDTGQVFDRAAHEIRTIFGKALFSEDGISMAEQVGNLLRAQDSTLSVAESCTGGLISHMITEIPGGSDYFLLSAVTYANDAKIRMLQVSWETLRQHGAVSRETVGEMAAGIRSVSGSTFGLATSGIAGPGGGSEEKPVGTVCIGLAGPFGTETHDIRFPFPERNRNKLIFSMAALDILRRKLLDMEREQPDGVQT